MTNLIYWPIEPPWLPMIGALYHFEDANGAQTFSPSDSKASRAVFASNGNLQCKISNGQSRFGSKSMHVLAAGGGGNYSSDADGPANITFGTKPFTIEYWVRPDILGPDTPGANKIQIDFRTSSGGGGTLPTIGTFFSRGQSAGDLGVLQSGSLSITAANVLTAATWHSICLCRTYDKPSDSLILRLFVDGVIVGSVTDNSSYSLPLQFNLGCAYSFSDGCVGYFDELRITNGTGWYGANYTPATAPFLNQ